MGKPRNCYLCKERLYFCTHCTEPICLVCDDEYYQYMSSMGVSENYQKYDGLYCPLCNKELEKSGKDRLFLLYKAMEKTIQDSFSLQRKYKNIAKQIEKRIKEIKK